MKIHVGRGTEIAALTVFPLWVEQPRRTTPSDRRYTVDPRQVRLSEHPDGPVVETLLASNDGERPALLLDGQLLEGGWQDRMLLRSAMVPAGATMSLEVRCVEAGRWGGTGDQRSRGRRASVRVRSATGRGGVPRSDSQGEVWRRVGEYGTRYGANPTSALTGHQDRAAAEVERYAAALRPLPGQTGVAIGVGGHPVMVEVFERQSALRREFRSIIRAAGMDAIGRPVERTPSRRVIRFVDRVTATPLREVAPAGEGVTLGGVGDHADVQALSWRDELVHYTASNPHHPLTRDLMEA